MIVEITAADGTKKQNHISGPLLQRRHLAAAANHFQKPHRADEPARCPEAFHSLHPRCSSQPLTGERHKWQKLQGCRYPEKRFRGPVDSTHARRSSYSVTPQPPPNLDIYS
jgi:hypothetical protein